MADDKMISEHDAVKRERAAFAAGALAYSTMDHNKRDPRGSDCEACARVRTEGESRYPLPKVKRPRVVTDTAGYEFRWFVVPNFPAAPDGCIQSRFRKDGCWTASLPSATSERIRLWHDVYSTPDELVDADD